MLKTVLYATQKVGNVLRALLQAYGSRNIKRYLWNREFSQGRWDCLERSSRDPVYPYVAEYANNGSILDLGCGSGRTGTELDETKYRHYTGVDISDVAIEKARQRTEKNARADRNSYAQSDITSYVPTQQYDVILFKDSVYYIRWGQIKALLDRYSKYLKERGVFIVRMWHANDKYKPIMDTIEGNFEVVEKRFFDQPKPESQCIRPRGARGLNTSGASERAVVIIFRRGEGRRESPRELCFARRVIVGGRIQLSLRSAISAMTSSAVFCAPVSACVNNDVCPWGDLRRNLHHRNIQGAEAGTPPPLIPRPEMTQSLLAKSLL